MSASALIVIAACTWANPGANPYAGAVPTAVHAYRDIPVAVRNKLEARMQRREYDEIADIRRDSIVGPGAEYVDLRSMHFGGGRLCSTVDRTAWTAQHVERGLVYCEAAHCLIVPTVCRNVARVTRIRRLVALEAAPGTVGTPALADTPYAVLFPPLELPSPGTAGEPTQPAARGSFVTLAYTPPLWPGPGAWVPLPPINEPPTSLLFLVGAGVLVLLRNNRRR